MKKCSKCFMRDLDTTLVSWNGKCEEWKRNIASTGGPSTLGNTVSHLQLLDIWMEGLKHHSLDVNCTNCCCATRKRGFLRYMQRSQTSLTTMSKNCPLPIARFACGIEFVPSGTPTWHLSLCVFEFVPATTPTWKCLSLSVPTWLTMVVKPKRK
jgi:hypothetical protein